MSRWAAILAGLMNWMVRMSAEMEVSMNCVERMIEYAPMDSEAPAVIDSNRPPEDWPQQGSIRFENLVVRYRPELPPVLHSLSFATKGQEKASLELLYFIESASCQCSEQFGNKAGSA